MKQTLMLQKMPADLVDTDENTRVSKVQYFFKSAEEDIEVNALLGKGLRLEFLSRVECVYCGRKTNKSFNQGYCYPCFRRLARCDTCIVKPETCHFEQGTCREPDWAQEFCFTDHIVYLSNTSGIKVGITRAEQVPTRWIDQGAIQAIPIFSVVDRKTSGLLEQILAQNMADKTNWRAMLKGEIDLLDMQEKSEVAQNSIKKLIGVEDGFKPDSITALNIEPTAIEFPVLVHPTKVQSFNFDKQPIVEGTLMGIKGQYLIFDTGVINIRKYGGYQVEITTL